ncbi:MAG: carbohydrate-binding family 9-like protein [Armatimonadota bacterium]
MTFPQRLITGSLMVILLVAATCCLADGPPLVQVGRTSTPPRVDGKLDDACWSKAALITPFMLNSGTTIASQQTVGRLCWDDRTLYLAFECAERALAPETQQLHLLKQAVKEHDGNVYGDESLEIFLRPGGSGSYYQLAANILGTKYESRGTDASFNGAWETATSSGREAWVLEMAVPFASLGVGVKPGDRWTFNVCRNENPCAEHSTWSGLQGAFHSPEQFGTMVLAEAAVPVRLTDVSDLRATAPALRLGLGEGSPALQATVTLKEGSQRQARATAAAGARTLAVPYPVATNLKSPSVQYEVALPDGTTIYRSPWFAHSGMLLDLTGELTLTGGSGKLLRNGQEIADLQPGKKTVVQTQLATGENVLALMAPGGAVLSGSLKCGAQTFGFDKGWRWSGQAAEGWDKPGFDAETWGVLKSGKNSAATLPGGAQACLRRVIVVSDRRERFWPMESGLNLPRGGRMFVKPLLDTVGVPPADYVYYLDLPAPVRIVAADNLDGAQLKPLRSERLRRDGREYTRYALVPVGTLTGGFTLETVWKNSAGTDSQYVSALSLGGNFDWRDFSVEITSPSFADLVGVLCLKWQGRGISGTCWYDDITLVEKGTTTNLLSRGDFEGDEWKGKGNLASYDKDGKLSRACKLSGTREQEAQQAGLWVSVPTIAVKPNTRYVLRMRAKGENIVAKGDVARASLLADVGSPQGEQLKVYSHYEALDGQVIEAERESTLRILPALKGRTPKNVPIIICYGSAAYENPEFWRANAAMVRGAGANWLWGANQSALSEALKGSGMRYAWPIDRDGFSQSPVDREYLTRHPDHAALQRNGAKSANQICPTVLLDSENEFIPKLREWLAVRIKDNPYDMIDWDHEFPTNYPNSVCLCERCRKAFATWAKLDTVPSPDQIWAQYGAQWIDFRCNLNARMAKIIRDACKAANPNIPFTVYSGYQTDHTRGTYGVDWSLMKTALDWGIAGYNGDRATLQRTLQTLGGAPFTGGYMYVEKRFQAERAYPRPEQWRIGLLRTALNTNGGGFLVWYLPVLDGGGYSGISWVSALIADFEGFFTDFKRQDDLVKVEPAQDEDALSVLTKGSERLVIAMNGTAAPLQMTLSLQELPAACALIEYETNKSYDPKKPLALSLEPGAIKVLHLSPRR